MKSPYENKNSSEWLDITKRLLENFPLSKDYLVSLVLKSWDSILKTKIAEKWSIAHDVQPKPQIMGFFLHEIIGQYIQADYSDSWRKEKTANDKDVVCITNPDYSLEIKTSSDKNKIFGNRSYAQEVKSGGKKSKSGYYLAINFEKFEETSDLPEIRLIRFGWLDHTDWIGQSSASGQQARLPNEVENGKLIVIYKKD
ncbi:MAG: ScaI family restriction endonuclease [Treponema sp.]